MERASDGKIFRPPPLRPPSPVQVTDRLLGHRVIIILIFTVNRIGQEGGGRTAHMQKNKQFESICWCAGSDVRNAGEMYVRRLYTFVL